jgi:bacteriorhodopsin
MTRIVSSDLWDFIGAGALLISYIFIFFQTKNLKSNLFNRRFLLGLIALAFGCYLVLGFGYGFTTHAHSYIYYPRYIIWVSATVMVLFSLLKLALPKSTDKIKTKDRKYLINSVITTDIFMIVSLILASYSSGVEIKRLFFSLSCLAFLGIIWAMFGAVRDRAEEISIKIEKVYSSLLVYFSVVWIFYPMVWLFGTSGTNNLSLYTENLIYAILDLLLIVGFWIYAVYLIIEPAVEPVKTVKPTTKVISPK